jgi:hypothetical protein
LHRVSDLDGFFGTTEATENDERDFSLKTLREKIALEITWLIFVASGDGAMDFRVPYKERFLFDQLSDY